MNASIKSVMTLLLVLGLVVSFADLVVAVEGQGGCSKACAKCEKCKKGFKSLFDGKTLKGWEGDKKLWFVENGMIVGRSAGIKSNQFLFTTKEYGDFVLYIKFRLVDGKGNSGFQIRSKKVGTHAKGYQADAGQKYWGWLYDEKRRGKLVGSPPETVKHYKPAGWNEYVICCKGPNIELKLNGFVTAKYVEKDSKIPRKGIIAPQLHVGPPMEIQIKEIRIKELPAK